MCRRVKRDAFLKVILLNAMLLAAIGLSVLSCQSGPDGPSDSNGDGLFTVTLTVSNYSQISFDDLSRAATTSSVPSDHPATLAHLLVAAFDAESGALVSGPVVHDQDDYEKNHDAYVTFTLKMPAGSYKLFALGYNGRRKCRLEALDRISWEEDYVPHTFFYCKPIEVNGSVAASGKVTLERAVAAFQINTSDVAPVGLKALRFTSTAGGTVLDGNTGCAVENCGRTSVIQVPDETIGNRVQATVYFFLPDNALSSDITVEALGAADKVLFKRQFNAVPLQLNKLTVWEGALFVEHAPVIDGVSDLSLYWDTHWTDTLRYTSD